MNHLDEMAPMAFRGLGFFLTVCGILAFLFLFQLYLAPDWKWYQTLWTQVIAGLVALIGAALYVQGGGDWGKLTELSKDQPFSKEGKRCFR